MVGGKQRDDSAARIGDAATQPHPVVDRPQIGEKRVVNCHPTVGRGYRADAHRHDIAGRLESQNAVRLGRRVSHQLTVDPAIDVVVVCGGRLEWPGSWSHGDCGRVRQFPGELGYVVNLLLAELHCGRQRDRVGQGTVGAAFGYDLHRYQRTRFEIVEVDLVDHRHVDR